jgi:hypothetical protein
VCKADADCTRFSNKVCDEASARCVACTVDTEAARCGNKSCNPATFTCTQTTRATLGDCDTCVADSECRMAASYRCVRVNVNGAAQNGKCLRRASATCSAPYRVTTTERTSLSGTAAEAYCAWSEARTTCEAVLAAYNAKPCASGTAVQCAASGAICGTVNSSPRICTIPCVDGLDCSTNAVCPTMSMDKYCGGM